MKCRKSSSGFTLVEVLIAVSLVAILVAVAVPSYRDQIRKTRRTEAVAALLDLASHMERYYADRRTYIGATVGDLLGSDKTENGHYTISIPADDLTAETYTLRADPATSAQIGDQCGAFTLTSAGIKGVTGEGMSAARCW